MTHVVFFSGGVGSYTAAKRVAARHGTTGLVLLFNDTRDEDADCYRFVIETAAALTGVSTDAVGPLLAAARVLGDEPGPERVARIAALQAATTPVLPRLAWQADGRDLWTLFNDHRYIGNTRVDVCSKTLKRQVGDRWLRKNHTPDDCVLYFGIDHSERDRFYGTATKPGIRRRLLPYTAEAPLCEPPYQTKCEMLLDCQRDGIDTPRLYDDGYKHNNCGGFCVKSGHAQFLHLLRSRPALFDYHARQERLLRERLDKDVSVLRDRRGGTTKSLPMAEFRRQVESGELVVNPRDWGRGCECYFPAEEVDAATVTSDEILTEVAV